MSVLLFKVGKQWEVCFRCLIRKVLRIFYKLLLSGGTKLDKLWSYKIDVKSVDVFYILEIVCPRRLNHPLGTLTEGF